MKQDLYIFDYNAEKNRKIDFFYSELLCEILFLQFKYGFKNLDKKNILNELPSLRNFNNNDIDKIYQNTINLLRIKYNIEFLQNNFKNIESE